MLYLIPALTAGMLGYMVWLLVFRLRRDRVAAERRRTRGRFAFRRPRERLRFLLDRAFGVADDKPEWEEPLVSSLAAVPIRSDDGSGEDQHRVSARREAG